MFSTSRQGLTIPKKGFFSAHKQVLSVQEMFLGNDVDMDDILDYFEAIGFFPLEEETHPLEDVMHYCSFELKPTETEEGAIYLIQTIPDLDISGNLVLHVVSLNFFSDTEGPIGDKD